MQFRDGSIEILEVLDLGYEIYKFFSVILKERRAPRKEKGHKKERKEEEDIRLKRLLLRFLLAFRNNGSGGERPYHVANVS